MADAGSAPGRCACLARSTGGAGYWLSRARDQGRPNRPGLTPEDCESAAWAVAPDGSLYRGAEAVNVALSAALRTRLPHVLYKLPVIGRWQDRVYRWIAANRRRLPGDVAHCSQHPHDCP